MKSITNLGWSNKLNRSYFLLVVVFFCEKTKSMTLPLGLKYLQVISKNKIFKIIKRWQKK